MHLISPPKFSSTLFSISLGTAVIPRRNEKQRLCKIWRGGDKVHYKVHYGKCGSGVYHQQVAAHSSFQITDISGGLMQIPLEL